MACRYDVLAEPLSVANSRALIDDVELDRLRGVVGRCSKVRQ